MENKSIIFVELVYINKFQQIILPLQVPNGSSIADAITISGLLDCGLCINLNKIRVGIWGSEVDKDYLLRASDRIEIYEQLLNDPRDIRRRLAQNQKNK